MGKPIFTPLGLGRIVYKLPCGRYLVEFPHGDGHLFYPQELFPGRESDIRGKSEYDKSNVRLAS